MKKILILIIIATLSMVNAASLVTAKEARLVTNKSTKRLFDTVMKSNEGKKAYNQIIKHINKNVSKIASMGYYNLFKITIFSKKIRSFLTPLSELERSVVRETIIKDLEKEGYKVFKGDKWNMSDYFSIQISW
jgi:hypothetical protein